MYIKTTFERGFALLLAIPGVAHCEYKARAAFQFNIANDVIKQHPFSTPKTGHSKATLRLRQRNWMFELFRTRLMAIPQKESSALRLGPRYAVQLVFQTMRRRG